MQGRVTAALWWLLRLLLASLLTISCTALIIFLIVWEPAPSRTDDTTTMAASTQTEASSGSAIIEPLKRANDGVERSLKGVEKDSAPSKKVGHGKHRKLKGSEAARTLMLTCWEEGNRRAPGIRGLCLRAVDFVKAQFVAAPLLIQILYVFMLGCLLLYFLHYQEIATGAAPQTELLVMNGPPYAGIIGTLVAFGQGVLASQTGDSVRMVEQLGYAIYTTVYGGMIYMIELLGFYIFALASPATNESGRHRRLT